MFHKTVSREIKKLLHPRSVSAVKLEGKTVDEKTVNSVSTYLVVYTICFMLILLLISVDGYDFETNFTASLSCLNNIGPGLDVQGLNELNLGPSGSFAGFSSLSKFTLTAAMLIGRLEIYPILILFLPKTWTCK
jgi:trk system potassium uptake protein TrkH